MRKSAWMLFGSITLAAASAAAADGEARSSEANQLPWARWQGRLSLGVNASPWRARADNAADKIKQASLMGDYYFARPIGAPGLLGGFRATSGLIVGSRGILSTGQPGTSAGGPFSIGSRLFGSTAVPYGSDTAPDNATLPYVGFGYTGLSARNGWSFSADLGLVAQGANSGVRLGRALGGAQSLDDAVREMRMAPLLQLGVSYSF